MWGGGGGVSKNLGQQGRRGGGRGREPFCPPPPSPPPHNSYNWSVNVPVKISPHCHTQLKSIGFPQSFAWRNISQNVHIFIVGRQERAVMVKKVKTLLATFLVAFCANIWTTLSPPPNGHRAVGKNDTPEVNYT